MKKFYCRLATLALSLGYSNANSQDYSAQIDALQNELLKMKHVCFAVSLLSYLRQTKLGVSILALHWAAELRYFRRQGWPLVGKNYRKQKPRMPHQRVTERDGQILVRRLHHFRLQLVQKHRYCLVA